jgi:hypothetical protein
MSDADEEERDIPLEKKYEGVSLDPKPPKDAEDSGSEKNSQSDTDQSSSGVESEQEDIEEGCYEPFPSKTDALRQGEGTLKDS